MPDPRVAPEPRWSLPPWRKAEIVAEIEAQARELMATVANPVHDFKHVQRLRPQARRAAVELGVHPDLADLAALLHDLGRSVALPDGAAAGGADPRRPGPGQGASGLHADLLGPAVG